MKLGAGTASGSPVWAAGAVPELPSRGRVSRKPELGTQPRLKPRCSDPGCRYPSSSLTAVPNACPPPPPCFSPPLPSLSLLPACRLPIFLCCGRALAFLPGSQQRALGTRGSCLPGARREWTTQGSSCGRQTMPNAHAAPQPPGLCSHPQNTIPKSPPTFSLCVHV